MKPTDKQIIFADEIAYALNLDFPTSSKEFTKQAYHAFISTHYEEFQSFIRDSDWDTGDEMDWFQMLNG